MANDATTSRWWRWGKRAGITLLVIGGILLLIQMLFTYVAESYLKQQIETAVSSPEKKLRANVGNLELSTLKQQIKINDFSIRPDTSALNSIPSRTPIDSLVVQDITFNGLHIFGLLFGDKLALDYISVTNPQIYYVRSASVNTDTGKGTALNTAILNSLKSIAQTLEIDDILITGFSGSARDSASDSPFATIHKATLHFADIRLDSAWAEEHTLLPSTRFNGSLDSLNWTLPNNRYDLRLQDLQFSSFDNSLSTQTIALVPRLKKYEFAKDVGHEIDRIDLNISKTEVKNIDLAKLIEKRTLFASSFHIKNSNIEIFHDKKPPAGEVEDKVFPHVKLRQIDQSVSIDSVIISNADIRYGEHRNRAPEPGYISFENTDAVITNISNVYPESGERQTIIMDASSEILGKGYLNAHFEFPVTERDSHTVAGTIGPMSVETLNPVLKNLGFVEAPSGQIHSINFNMNMGTKQSTGTLNMHYTDLKVEMINFDNQDEEESEQLKSFLANTFVIKKNNEPPLRQGKISFERIPEKSIFNYWWKSLLSGLKSSVGL